MPESARGCLLPAAGLVLLVVLAGLAKTHPQLVAVLVGLVVLAAVIRGSRGWLVRTSRGAGVVGVVGGTVMLLSTPPALAGVIILAVSLGLLVPAAAHRPWSRASTPPRPARPTAAGQRTFVVGAAGIATPSVTTPSRVPGSARVVRWVRPEIHRLAALALVGMCLALFVLAVGGVYVAGDPGFAKRYGSPVTARLPDSCTWFHSLPAAAAQKDEVTCHGSWQIGGATVTGTVHGKYADLGYAIQFGNARTIPAYALGDDAYAQKSSKDLGSIAVLGRFSRWWLLPLPVALAGWGLLNWIRRNKAH